jgi:hypothetical protein
MNPTHPAASDYERLFNECLEKQFQTAVLQLFARRAQKRLGPEKLEYIGGQRRDVIRRRFADRTLQWNRCAAGLSVSG